MTHQRVYDVIVAGLGAMGSAAAFHLSRKGASILGLDRYAPPHTLGSSHGQTRIIREAYFEHPAYVPLVQRAYELWADLEAATDRRLFRATGGLMIGPRNGIVFNGAHRSAREHRLAHEVLSGGELRERFPAFTTPDCMAAVWEPRAGVLFPDDCIAAHLRLAQRQGAALRYDEPVLRWRPCAEGIEVSTPSGQYVGRQLVCSAGAWNAELLHNWPLPLRVERQVLYWFEPRAHADWFTPERCPVYIFEYEPGRFFYGFPDLGTGVKVARHHEGRTSQPNSIDRQIAADEVEEMRQVLRRFLPEADGALREATVCMYTDTPDGHFLIDRHPHAPQVLLASPCSGHGFKFSSAIGEVLADLVTTGQSHFDLQLFRADRFRTTT